MNLITVEIPILAYLMLTMQTYCRFNYSIFCLLNKVEKTITYSINA